MSGLVLVWHGDYPVYLYPSLVTGRLSPVYLGVSGWYGLLLWGLYYCIPCPCGCSTGIGVYQWDARILDR